MDKEIEILRVSEIDITNIIKQKTKQGLDVYSSFMYRGSNTYLIYFNYHKELGMQDYITILNKHQVNEFKFRSYIDFYNKTNYQIKWYNIYEFRFKNNIEEEFNLL